MKKDRYRANTVGADDRVSSISHASKRLVEHVHDDDSIKRETLLKRYVGKTSAHDMNQVYYPGAGEYSPSRVISGRSK